VVHNEFICTAVRLTSSLGRKRHQKKNTDPQEEAKAKNERFEEGKSCNTKTQPTVAVKTMDGWTSTRFK
jgi:hypothetical protein